MQVTDASVRLIDILDYVLRTRVLIQHHMQIYVRIQHRRYPRVERFSINLGHVPILNTTVGQRRDTRTMFRYHA